MKRIIGHLDMDAFFAAVEELANPQFRGRPIVVGADPREGKGRGVVSTANYKAREYGIRSALPITRAWRYSENARKAGKEPAVFLPGNHRRYGEISRRIMGVIEKHSPQVEVASVDEAYFDLSDLGTYEKATRIANSIKKEIVTQEKLTASVGIGPNKLIAKIASDFKKPDGLTVVREEEAEQFLESMAIRKMPGIGPKTEVVLKRLGVTSVKDAKHFSLDQMREQFGKWGSSLYYRIRGIDTAPVGEEYERKSIGEQETFVEDTLHSPTVIERMDWLCEDVFRRFSRSGFTQFRTVVITVRFADFKTQTKSRTLAAPAATCAALKRESLKSILPFFDRRQNPKLQRMRLIGVRVEKLQ